MSTSRIHALFLLHGVYLVLRRCGDDLNSERDILCRVMVGNCGVLLRVSEGSVECSAVIHNRPVDCIGDIESVLDGRGRVRDAVVDPAGALGGVLLAGTDPCAGQIL